VIVAPPRTARPPAAGNGDVRWFAWNGQTFDSLSKVAFAITGTTKTSVDDEIAHLRGLDLGGLRARWQGVFRRPAPAHLTRHLLFAVIAYRLQADHLGSDCPRYR